MKNKIRLRNSGRVFDFQIEREGRAELNIIKIEGVLEHISNNGKMCYNQEFRFTSGGKYDPSIECVKCQGVLYLDEDKPVFA